MKVAIIGAGISGLSCALELEKNGIVPDIFQIDDGIGWLWPSVSFWPGIVYRRFGNVIDYLISEYDIDFVPLAVCKKIIMKSPGKKSVIEGNIGYFIERGRSSKSLESQLFGQLKKAKIQYNTHADYKQLSGKYDWVVICTGRDNEARELGVWEDKGMVRIIGGITSGSFEENSASVYFNTDYAGIGFARLTPFNCSKAIVALNIFGKNEYESETLFNRFIKTEGLDSLTYIFKYILPSFTCGRVKAFRVNNILLAGRAAGLVETFIGTGGVETLISGVLAARAILLDLDYDSLMEPLQNHIEIISFFRKLLGKYSNDDFDRFVSTLGTPGIKQLVYNTDINVAEIIAAVLNNVFE